MRKPKNCLGTEADMVRCEKCGLVIECKKCDHKYPSSFGKCQWCIKGEE